eukprot:SAG22_NODE_3421_length_1721_cov_1.113440_2_plen_67_part_01
MQPEQRPRPQCDLWRYDTTISVRTPVHALAAVSTAAEHKGTLDAILDYARWVGFPTDDLDLGKDTNL